MQPIKAVFFDFDGVLSKDRFYFTLFEEYPLLKEQVVNIVFKSDEKLGDKWMRGEVAHQVVSQKIADITGIPYEKLNSGLISSIKQFVLDKNLLRLAKRLQKNNIAVALVTNNMDVFNQVTIPTHKLLDYFPTIVNSSDFGCMKHENNGKLFDIAIEKVGCINISNILLIDDSEKACSTFLNKGGQVHRYTDNDNFMEWFGTSVLSDLED